MSDQDTIEQRVRRTYQAVASELRVDARPAPVPSTAPPEKPRHHVRTHIALALVIVAVTALIAVARATSETASHRVHINADAPTSTPTAVANCALSTAQAADFVSQVHQQGHTALQSQLVNVTGNGSYVLVFGPLTSHDNARFGDTQRSSGLSFPYVLDNFSAQPHRDRMTKVIGVDGDLYVDVPVSVTDFKAPCGLRAWLQY